MAEGKVAADPVGKCIFYFHNFYIFLISFSFSKSRKFPKFVVLTIYTSKVVLNILFLNFVERCWVLFLFLGDSIIGCVMKISSQNWFEKNGPILSPTFCAFSIFNMTMDTATLPYIKNLS